MNVTASPGVRWMLVGSLALNVALVAGMGWHYFELPKRHAKAMYMHGDRFMPSPRLLRQGLPEERHGVVDAVLDRHRPTIRGAVREVFQARGDVHDAMEAEPFDAAALERAFAALRERDVAAASAVQAMLGDLMGQLTPEERSSVTELMHRHHHGRRGGRDRGRG
ncbi:MAG TPA: periplasmic heavy metal sensor [Xanthomonadaceae bacterium]|nr:periplasmic heavy metal sensor [Xanthomonadaceae bacterium]